MTGFGDEEAMIYTSVIKMIVEISSLVMRYRSKSGDSRIFKGSVCTPQGVSLTHAES
jgi:hypothetical protein